MRVEDTNQKQTDKTNRSKPLVHNIFILDCSASMFPYRNQIDSKYSGAFRSINEELKLLKSNKDVDFTHSLVEFGEREKIFYTRWMEDNNSSLIERSENLGNTALNDAIYQTLEKVLKDKSKDDKVLIKVMTDGEENNSQKSFTEVKLLIETAKENNVTVTFFGTKYDTDRAVHNYNLSRGNTMVHNNTVEEFSQLVNRSVSATMSYSKAVVDGANTVEDFYSKTVDNK